MLQYLVRYDLTLCLWLNRAGDAGWIRASFRLVSRLGDGAFWYVLMLMLPLIFGHAGLMASAHMLAVGVIGLVIYKWTKQRTARPRPYSVLQAIRLGMDPLDQYSFPSGHTLHAVGFTLVAIQYFPLLAWILVPFALLVAASRVVLGLHYPTDVLCGAVIGAVLALGPVVWLG